MNALSQPYFMQALDALKRGERRSAAALLARQLNEGNTSPRNLASVSQLAAHIGEANLAIEAMRQAVVPGSLESSMSYWATLANFGRSDEALGEIEGLPVTIRDNPAVLHFRGNVANEYGRFQQAEELFRKALAKAPEQLQTWFSLAMVKTFTPGDADLAAMTRLDQQVSGPDEVRASLSYALGKAHEDCGDFDQAFGYYAKGAAMMRRQGGYDPAQFPRAADAAIAGFSHESLSRLAPSQFHGRTPLFVTGLPRSGTTLTEQMLRDHPAVSDGGEINLLAAALIPTRGASIQGSQAYQAGFAGPDPWGEIARDYAYLVDVRFRAPSGLVVDKSLGQAMATGLLLHALPNARIAWLRRSPDDVALSCFRTYFSTGLPWTWSLTDIADHMRAEDRLFDHWRTLFPDRILQVPYEELVADPGSWKLRLQEHFGLAQDNAPSATDRTERAITTASVGQAREEVTTARVGRAAAFERHLKPFRDRYYS